MSDIEADAAAYKEQGNAKFKSGEYQQAAELYAKAIDLDPSNAVLYSNRSNAFLQLSDFKNALEDAQKATSLRPEWDKGWYRTGSVLEAQGKLAKALKAYQSALDCSPTNEQILIKVRALKQQQKGTGKQQQSSEAKAQQQQQQQHHNKQQYAHRVSPEMPGPAAWANGLTRTQQFEWLVDCYRMRVDDDYCWGGGNLHELYHPKADTNKVVEDFLAFCKLAVKAKVLPSGWDWPAFLSKAPDLLPYVFEKEDAKEKWGRENVFAAAFGGRSLRYTAEIVYGSSVQLLSEPSQDAELIQRQARQHWLKLLAGKPTAFFEDVGGKDVWQLLGRNFTAAKRASLERMGRHMHM